MADGGAEEGEEEPVKDLIDELLSDSFLTRRLTGRTRFDRVNEYVKYSPAKVAAHTRNQFEKQLRSRAKVGFKNDESSSSRGNRLAVSQSENELIVLQSDGKITQLRRFSSADTNSTPEHPVIQLTHEPPVKAVNLTYDSSESTALIFLQHESSISFYVVIYGEISQTSESRKIEEPCASSHDFKRKIAHTAISRFHPARVYFALENPPGKSGVGFVDFESGSPDVVELTSKSPWIQPRGLSPFQAYCLKSCRTAAVVVDYRAPPRTTRVCTVADNLDKIGSVCELDHDRNKVAVADAGRVDLYDIRCPGRRLYAWDTNVFGTVEDKYVSFDLLQTAKIATTNPAKPTALNCTTGLETLVGCCLGTNKIQAFPVDHSQMDIYGQVTRHRDARLDPSDILKIDTPKDVLFPLTEDTPCRVYDINMSRPLPTLDGLAVAGETVYTLYDGVILAQKLSNAENSQTPCQPVGFDAHQAAIYSYFHGNSAPIQVRSRQRVEFSISDTEEESDGEDTPVLAMCRSNFERMKAEKLANPENDCPELYPNVTEAGKNVTAEDLRLLGGAVDENKAHDNYHSRLAGLWDTFRYIRLDK